MGTEKGQQGNPTKKCKFCNKTGHGRNPDERTRKKSCRAFDKVCYKCEGSGHFANTIVCKIKKDDVKNNAMDSIQAKDSTATFSYLKVKPDKDQVNINAIKQEISRIGNLDWNKELMHWVKRKPRGMAEMRVNIRVLEEDQKFWHPNKSLGDHWPNASNRTGRIKQVKVIPDTGAVVTCAGIALLHNLNLAPSILIPTSQSIVAANNKSLHVMGAIMVEIKAEKEGREKSTKQFCYICKEVTGLYLSLSACEDLDGVLPWNKGINWIKVDEDKVKINALKCDCPVRSQPPAIPDKMPFDAI